MICRGALVRALVVDVRFRCRPLRRVLLTARRALRLMKSCDARASFAVANPGLEIPGKRRLGSRELIVSRVLCRRRRRHRRERLFVQRRVRVRVRKKGRIGESNGVRRVTSRGR